MGQAFLLCKFSWLDTGYLAGGPGIARPADTPVFFVGCTNTQWRRLMVLSFSVITITIPFHAEILFSPQETLLPQGCSLFLGLVAA